MSEIPNTRDLAFAIHRDQSGDAMRLLWRDLNETGFGAEFFPGEEWGTLRLHTRECESRIRGLLAAAGIDVGEAI